MRQVLLLFLFLRGDTETQRTGVTRPGYSVSGQKSQVLNLSLTDLNLRLFPPSFMASRRWKGKESVFQEEVPKKGLCSGRP